MAENPFQVVLKTGHSVDTISLTIYNFLFHLLCMRKTIGKKSKTISYAVFCAWHLHKRLKDVVNNLHNQSLQINDFDLPIGRDIWCNRQWNLIIDDWMQTLLNSPSIRIYIVALRKHYACISIETALPRPVLSEITC